ncbi:MAG: ABC transporter transmembrane domain-containing protein [Pseudomonadota bacterium]
MLPTLLAYTWTHSKREQLVLLAITLTTLPVLYVTLEAPKRIINEAIGSEAFPIETVLGAFGQLEYLALWCAIFLISVIVGGLLKMQLNLMKGVLAERLLRRFRYQLIERIHRFPLAHFRRTSQGELISMVNAEAEPLAGIMGDFVAQPLFQAGQMLTIMLFLFMQNVWLAIAAIALIPLQAYLIPLIQRRINVLNKARVLEVRQLAEQMGDSVAGMRDLRANNLFRYTMARFSHRLGRIFAIRYKIYRLKFFMKFLNNFINQLTPFFFFSIGGYLVIQGDLTLGALVAALAAFKDLSAPWKDLLAFYNQYADMSLRYRTVIERFDPPKMFQEALFEPGSAADISLKAPIRFENFSVGETTGMPTLVDLSLEVPAGAMVGVETANATERAAFVDALSRGVAAQSGRITIDGRDLASLPQEAIARRIGAVPEVPYLFNGTIGRNIVAPLLAAPLRPEGWSEEVRRDAAAAAAVGAQPDPFEVDWMDPNIAGVEDSHELRLWWLRIIEAIGTDTFLVNRALFSQIAAQSHPELADRVVALRDRIAERLEAAGLGSAVTTFGTETYHPGLAVGENLIFAIPNRPGSLDEIAGDKQMSRILDDLGLRETVRSIAEDLLDTLIGVFGGVGAEHPLFRKTGLEPAHFDTLSAWRDGMLPEESIAKAEALLMALPFKIAADTVPGAIDDSFQRRILDIRNARGAELREQAGAYFTPIDRTTYVPGLTLLENAVFGKVEGPDAERVGAIVAETLIEDGLKADVAITIADVETGIGGSALPPVARERIGLVRAVVKRPDILILDRALANHDQAQRQHMRENLRALLPETTIFFLEPEIAHSASYDLVLKIEQGRILGQEHATTDVEDGGATKDLAKKIQVIRGNDVLGRLTQDQVRLLAFASDWIHVDEGQYFFRNGEPTDGAYILVTGEAELLWPNAKPGESPVATVQPGRMVGDLSVILKSDRTIEMFARTACVALRIRKDELHMIIENDAGVAASLLETVAGYLVASVSDRRGAPTEETAPTSDSAREPV